MEGFGQFAIESGFGFWAVVAAALGYFGSAIVRRNNLRRSPSYPRRDASDAGRTVS